MFEGPTIHTNLSKLSSDWKTAHFVPAYLKVDRSLPDNSRLISLMDWYKEALKICED